MVGSAAWARDCQRLARRRKPRLRPRLLRTAVPRGRAATAMSGSRPRQPAVRGAVLYRYRAVIPWRDLPERYDDPIKVHTRFSRWVWLSDRSTLIRNRHTDLPSATPRLRTVLRFVRRPKRSIS